jgi:hypothetical protein
MAGKPPQHMRKATLPMPFCETPGNVQLTMFWDRVSCKRCHNHHRIILLTEMALVKDQLKRAVEILERLAPDDDESKQVINMYRLGVDPSEL